MLKLASLQSVALSGGKAVAAALLIQACVGAHAQASSPGGPRAIEGIWYSTITVKDCVSGAVLGPPGKALIVFRRGGTFDVDTSEGYGVFGDIYGLWEHVGGKAFKATAVHFRFNPDNTLAGLNKAQRSVTLSADAGSFTSVLKVQVLDLDGNVLFEACPTEEAVRMNL
jgi:hypothetical protein